MTNREKQILDLIRANPLISQMELSVKLGIKRSSVAVHIGNLIKKGLIKGKGYIVDDVPCVAVIGGANVDIAGFINNETIARDSNPGKIRISSGGVGRNIAENLARLGVNTKLITAVGDDLFSQKIIEDCIAAGVDTSLSRKISGAPSSIYLAVLNKKGEMDLAVSDMEVIEEISTDYLKNIQAVLNRASIIVMDTNLSNASLEYVAETYGNKLYLDTVSTAKALKVRPFLRKCHTIKPNRKEAEALTGMEIKTLAQANDALSFFLDLGLNSAIISMGEKGVVYGSRTERGKFKLNKTDISNATGAGDAFMAGLVCGRMTGKNLKESVKLASIASYLTMKNEKTAYNEITLDKIDHTLKELNL